MASVLSVTRSDDDRLLVDIDSLLARPEKDAAKGDRLVSDLDGVQLDIKA
jgi:hypothetical protein